MPTLGLLLLLPLLLLSLTTRSFGSGAPVVKPGAGTFTVSRSTLQTIRCSASDVVADNSRKLSAVDLRRADDSNSSVARVSSRRQPSILSYTDRVWCSVKGAAGQATNAFLELTCLVVCQHLDLSKQGLYCSYYGQDTSTSPPIVTHRQATVLECATRRPGHTTPGGSRQLSEEVPHGVVQKKEAVQGKAVHDEKVDNEEVPKREAVQSKAVHDDEVHTQAVQKREAIQSKAVHDDVHDDEVHTEAVHDQGDKGEAVPNLIISLLHAGIRFKSEDASGTQFVRYKGSSTSSSSTASASAVEGRSEMFVRKAETSSEVRLLVVVVDGEGDEKTPQPSSANFKCEVEIGSQFFPVAATEAEAEHHSATDSSKFSTGTVVGAFVGGTVLGLLALALSHCVNKRKSDCDRSQTQGDQSTPLTDLGKRDGTRSTLWNTL